MLPARPLTRRIGGDERFGFGTQPKALAPGMECFGRHSHDRLPLSRVECACLLLSQEQVYLRWAGNATFFRHFLAHFPSILANELRDLTEEGDRKWKKESFRCHARLCERTNALKALGSVANYLENDPF
jgi:hypothetical protein